MVFDVDVWRRRRTGDQLPTVRQAERPDKVSRQMLEYEYGGKREIRIRAFPPILASIQYPRSSAIGIDPKHQTTMNLAVRIAAAILSVPPDVLAPFVPMLAPSPRNGLEIELRNEVDSALSGSCCRSSSSSGNDEPLFAISREEAHYVDCKSGLPSTSMEEGLFNSDEMSEPPSTYGEITSLGM